MANWDSFALGLVGALQAAEDRNMRQQEMDRANKYLEYQVSNANAGRDLQRQEMELRLKELERKNAHDATMAEYYKANTDLIRKRGDNLDSLIAKRAAGGAGQGGVPRIDWGPMGAPAAPGGQPATQPFTLPGGGSAELGVPPVSAPVAFAPPDLGVPTSQPEKVKQAVGAFDVAGPTQGVGKPAAAARIEFNPVSANMDALVLAGLPVEQVLAQSQASKDQELEALRTKYTALRDELFQRNPDPRAQRQIAAEINRRFGDEARVVSAKYGKGGSAAPAAGGMKADRDAQKMGEDRRKELLNAAGAAKREGEGDDLGEISAVVSALDDANQFNPNHFGNVAIMVRNALRDPAIQAMAPGQRLDAAYEFVNAQIAQKNRKSWEGTPAGQANAKAAGGNEFSGAGSRLQDDYAEPGALPPNGADKPGAQSVLPAAKQTPGQSLPGKETRQALERGWMSLFGRPDAQKEAPPAKAAAAPYLSPMRKAMDRGLDVLVERVSEKFTKPENAGVKYLDYPEGNAVTNVAETFLARPTRALGEKLQQFFDIFRKAPPEQQALIMRNPELRALVEQFGPGRGR